MQATVCIGLGSLLMTDDGVGVHVLRALRQRGAANVDFEELGTDGMAVLHVLPGRRKAVVVDCARMGEAPGAVRRFRPDEVRSRPEQPRFSLHQGDLLGVLDLARALGEAPDDVVIFGIEPAVVAPGMDLSPALRARLPDYCRVVAAELEDAPHA